MWVCFVFIDILPSLFLASIEFERLLAVFFIFLYAHLERNWRLGV